MQVNVRDADGHVRRVPAQATLDRDTPPSTESVSSLEKAADGSAPGVVVKAKAWTRVCVYGGVSALKGPVGVTDVLLRIGADAAIVWTLANLPAGQPRVVSQLCACLAQMLGCTALPMLVLCTTPNQVLKGNVMVQNAFSRGRIP